MQQDTLKFVASHTRLICTKMNQKPSKPFTTFITAVKKVSKHKKQGISPWSTHFLSHSRPTLSLTNY